MATIQFYEKPGCINNTRQKNLLSKAGHLLIIYDLLQHPWAENPEHLRSFFGDKPVADWFNRSAPAVKNGEVIPEKLDEQQAIALMVANPLLIRRPLIEVEGRRCSGFDPNEIEAWLTPNNGKHIPDMETCPSQIKQQACQP